ncbi:Aspartate/methionine/tyrosine aminotransferase [Chishuiella changwenlii]|uniref:Aminotransferase n=1 Tax=Chishuiella changwenlii TaxID=1434701 RepID=A0A1M6ZQU9_9FLAO|nr:aminotransferase class I/II-fold pyridoxal phosphate-dependent enzyme [Chishuiella changwenlii]GGE92851.1 aminotransferase [Chishuiella changwenlii]SHL32842.1 Aspartate/methionine/tyrosine aminotransferase [Chishuiella changwenlii]
MITEAQRLQSVQEYYFSKKLQEIANMKTEIPIISLGIGSPDLQPHPEVIEELINVSQSGINGYQSYRGIPEMREAMSTFYQNKFNVSANPSTEILPLIGSKEGIMHISMAFLNEGDKVLIPNPGYPTYSSVTELVQAEPLFYDLKDENNWLPDFEKLEKLAEQQPKIMWINYPHMPTGAKASKDVLRKLVEFATRHNILIVNDNPYSFILNDEPMSILSIDGAKEVCIELNSLSKTFNIAGWRVGMVIGKENFINSILKVKSNMDSGMNFAIQKAATKALLVDNSWYDELTNIYAERRKIIWEIADLLNVKYNREAVGMFIWAKLPNDKKDDKTFIDEILYDKKIFITPGSIFGSNGKGFIRFSLCAPLEKLIEVKKRLEA